MVRHPKFNALLAGLAAVGLAGPSFAQSAAPTRPPEDRSTTPVTPKANRVKTEKKRPATKAESGPAPVRIPKAIRRFRGKIGGVHAGPDGIRVDVVNARRRAASVWIKSNLCARGPALAQVSWREHWELVLAAVRAKATIEATAQRQTYRSGTVGGRSLVQDCVVSLQVTL